MQRALAIVAALALLPCAARAEDPADPADSADPVKSEPVMATADPEVFRDADVVVIGTKPETVTILQNSAIETEWIGEQEIEQLPARDVAGVVQYLAGIRTTQRIQGQKAAVSIEGMPVEYTEILVDGQRFSGEVGGAGDLSDFPLENVERIEILRGAQGTRYGTNAAGGVINVVTKNPPAKGYRVDLQSEGGTDNMALGGATAAGRIGPLGLSLSGLYEQIDGFDPPDDDDVVLARAGGKDSTDRENFLYGKWDAPLGENVTLRGNGLWRVEHDDVVFEDETSSESSNLTDTNWRANTGFDWRAREDTNVATDLTFYAVDTDSQVGRSFNLFEDELDADLYADHELETGPLFHKLRGGAELDWQRLDQHERNPFVSENEELGQQNLDETFFAPSVYVQSESSYSDWLSVVLGVRGQWHSQFDAKALPQVGVLVRPFESLSLRASWGLNYRTPSLRDLYQPPAAQLGGAYFLAGNENLKAESSSSYRAGFEWSPLDWMSVASTGFYNDIDDYIRSQFERELVLGRETRLFFPEDLGPEEVTICETQRMFFPDQPELWTPECAAYFAGEPIEREVLIKAPLFVKQNLDSVRTWGVESQLRLRVSSYAQISLAYTWLKTKVVQSNIDIDELPNEPEHTVGARVVLKSPWWDTQLATALRWSSGVIPEGSGTGLLSFADPSQKTDPSYQLDFRLAQPVYDTFFFHTIRLHFDAMNVTDERRQDSYAIRGRSFIAGISGEFGSAR
jgi:outer membrane receptor for ferrienterochelin and colicins